MPAAADLQALYHAVYGKPPSSQTATALVRMEQMFSPMADDALARCMVILLHAADRVEDVGCQCTAEQKAIVPEIRGLMNGLTLLIRDVETARVKVKRRGRRAVRQLEDEAVIAVHASASPLFAYLAHAFRRRTGVLKADERVLAARGDLYGTGLLLLAVLAMVAVAGILVGQAL